MTKKRSSEILGVKMEIFPQKPSFRNLGLRAFIPPPQTRRQVSAYACVCARACSEDMWDLHIGLLLHSTHGCKCSLLHNYDVAYPVIAFIHSFIHSFRKFI